MKIIDYLYYWFYNYYKRKNKIDDYEIKAYHKMIHCSAAIALTALLFLLLFSFFLIIGSLVPSVFSVNKLLVVCIILGFCVLTFILLTTYYKDKIYIISAKFDSKKLNKKLKGWMMFLFMYSLLLFPVFFSLVLRLIKK